MAVFMLAHHGITLIKFARCGFRKKRLLVLYLYADREKYGDSFAVLESLLKQMVFMDKTIVKIDNFNEKKPVSQDRSVFDIAGDNKYWEFSGWQKGIDFAKEKLSGTQFDTVLFVNDAFLNGSFANGFSCLYRFNSVTLWNLNGCALGNLVSAGENMTLLGEDVSRFMRTNLFALPYDIASNMTLASLSDELINELVPEQFNESLLKKNSSMSNNLQGFLRHWIKIGWPRSVPVAEENWPIIRGKIIAILNERMLSATLRENQVNIVDVSDSRHYRRLFPGC